MLTPEIYKHIEDDVENLKIILENKDTNTNKNDMKQHAINTMLNIEQHLQEILNS